MDVWNQEIGKKFSRKIDNWRTYISNSSKSCFWVKTLSQFLIKSIVFLIDFFRERCYMWVVSQGSITNTVFFSHCFSVFRWMRFTDANIFEFFPQKLHSVRLFRFLSFKLQLDGRNVSDYITDIRNIYFNWSIWYHFDFRICYQSQSLLLDIVILNFKKQFSY